MHTPPPSPQIWSIQRPQVLKYFFASRVPPILFLCCRPTRTSHKKIFDSTWPCPQRFLVRRAQAQKYSVAMDDECSWSRKNGIIVRSIWHATIQVRSRFLRPYCGIRVGRHGPKLWKVLICEISLGPVSCGSQVTFMQRGVAAKCQNYF